MLPSPPTPTPNATLGSGPPNLTRDAAQRRAAVIRQVHSYEVAVDISGAAGPADADGRLTFPTRALISFDATPGASTFLDFVGDKIGAARLNGVPLDVDGWSNSTGLALSGLAASNELEVDATGVYTNTGEGLHRFVDPEDGRVYLYSQFETADAKRLFPCFDQPDLKATFTVEVVAPAGWSVVGNGAELPAEGDPGPGPARHRFATTEPLSTYVTALIAGPYHVVADEHDGIALRLFCRPTLAEFLDADRLFAQTKQGFDFFHRVFGVRYPFGKYDQLFVPEFNAGAMENAGAVTFREEYVFRSRVTRYSYERRCETILHEMAHMWFGDLVTMRWWDDLWLNESFATWASVLAQSEATEFDNAWTTFANVEKSWAYVQDQLPSTHPIAADMVDLDAVEVNFDGITYAKGASVLKQLAAYVGRKEFLAGLRAYFQAHAFGNASLADLLDALEAASGRDLRSWSAAWLQTTGLNTIRAQVEPATGRGPIESLTLLQEPATPGAGELRPHRLAVGIYADDGAGRLVRTRRVELDVTGERTDVGELVGVDSGDLVLVNDDDLTYAKVRLDPRSQRTAVARIGDIAESLPRTLVWSALWEMTRDGELPAREFLRAATSGLPGETEIGVVQRILAQMQVSMTSYAEPGWAADTGWPALVELLVGLAGTAPAGADVQLAAVNALAGSRLDRATVDRLAGWRDGSAPLAGLTVDADLSWSLLGALVAHGAAGASDVDAAVAADPTASGERRAATVRALLPDPVAKQATWDRLVNDDSMANALQDATIAGFTHPAQTELLTPFVSPYFAMLDGLWSRRSVEVAKKVVVGLYPRWSIDESTVGRALDWAAGQHPAALDRLVSEGRAGTERALRARTADAAASGGAAAE